MRTWAIISALNAFLAVAAGAFGAHALRGKLTPEMLTVFETAVRYHMYHALGLTAVAFAVAQGRPANSAGWLMLIGIVLFSGSFYALSLSGARQLGAITPIGGLSLLASWAALAWSYFRS